MKTATIILEDVKDSDQWFVLCSDLGYTEDDNAKCYEMFEYGEYATMEIVVDENFNIVGGKIIKSGKK